MKSMFKGYIGYTNEEFETLWSNAKFIIDTNIILNFFKYTKESYINFFMILEKLKKQNRLFIPHQVALEYFFNYRENMEKQELAINSLAEKLSATKDIVEKHFLKVKNEHPYIEEDVFQFYLDALEQANNELEIKGELLIKNLPDMEIVHKRVLNLLDGVTGSPYIQQKLDEIQKRGKYRYEQMIPPGFKDKLDKNNSIRTYGEISYNQQFGDLILWNQLIDFSLENKVPLIFVTEDNKEDWWHKKRGQVVGPHPNLIQEFYEKTNHNFYMYRADSFIKYAVYYLNLEVNQKSVDELVSQFKNIRFLDNSTLIENRRERNKRRGPVGGVFPKATIEKHKNYLNDILERYIEDPLSMTEFIEELNVSNLNISDIEELRRIVPGFRIKILKDWIQKVESLIPNSEGRKYLILFGINYFYQDLISKYDKEINRLFNKLSDENQLLEYHLELMNLYRSVKDISNTKIKLNQFMNIIDTLENEIDIMNSTSVEQLNLLNDL